MNKDSNPIDYLIECCEKSINTGYWTITQFNILNAKDELKKLQFKEFEKIRDPGDLYDLIFNYNKFGESNPFPPIYVNREELNKWLDSRR